MLPGNFSLRSDPVEGTEVAITSTVSGTMNGFHKLYICSYHSFMAGTVILVLWLRSLIMAGLGLTYPSIARSSCSVPGYFAVKPANAMFVPPPPPPPPPPPSIPSHHEARSYAKSCPLQPAMNHPLSPTARVVYSDQP